MSNVCGVRQLGSDPRFADLRATLEHERRRLSRLAAPLATVGVVLNKTVEI